MAKPQPLTGDVARAFDDLAQILVNLNFQDNFRHFRWEGEILAGAELKIQHPLKRIPTGYIIIRNKSAPILCGDTDWTTEHVYLKNYSGAITASGVVLFYI